MSRVDAISPDLAELLNGLCEGALDPQDAARLEHRICVDPAACRLYFRYIDVHVELRRRFGGGHASGHADAAAPISLPVIVPSSPILSSPFHGMAGYFSEGWAVSYLLATVVTGLGILGFWLMPVSRPEQLARNAEPVIVEPKAEYVGRITGTVDCKWEKKGLGIRDSGLEKSSRTERPTCQSLIPNPQSLVSLGDKFLLSSGLLEITYATGAKVILQGPVTYEVESNGGYLSVGKLTGKLEKRGEWRVESGEGAANQKSEIGNQKPRLSTIHYPLFTIRTPTATVTDLGTQFGVEVSKDGITDAHVFVGEVQVATGSGPGNSTGSRQTRVIFAGQSARVRHNELVSLGKEVAAASAGRFARTLPAAQRTLIGNEYAKLVLSMKPAAYYRMEEFSRGRDENTYVLVDSAPGAHHGILRQDRGFRPRAPGRFGGALDLHGPMVCDYGIVYDYPRADGDQLSVSAWVWALALDRFAAIVDNYWPSPSNQKNTGQFFLGLENGLCLQAAVRSQNGEEARIFEGGGGILPRNTWQHVAFVADGTVLRLYRNGVELGSTPCRGIARQRARKGLSIGCVMDESGDNPHPTTPCFWNGYLDEIAIFNHALSPEQIRQLYTGTLRTKASETPRYGD